MTLIALRPTTEENTRGTAQLELGANVFARIAVETRPAREGGVVVTIDAVPSEGAPPSNPDNPVDPLLSGVTFRTVSPTRKEALEVAREFLRQRLETNINFMTVINTERTES